MWRMVYSGGDGKAAGGLWQRDGGRTNDFGCFLCGPWGVMQLWKARQASVSSRSSLVGICKDQKRKRPYISTGI